MEVTINATDSDLQDWEWVVEGKGYRAWLISGGNLEPADRVDSNCPRRMTVATQKKMEKLLSAPRQ